MAGELRPRRRDVRALRGQAGATLIEILVVAAVMVPIILAATLGLLTTVKLSSANRVSQELDAAAASYVESLKDVTYVGCAGPTGYDGATGLWVLPTNITVDVLSVEYWDQSAGDYVASCPTPDEGAQLITVELEDRDSAVRLEVTKRNPAAVPGGTP